MADVPLGKGRLYVYKRLDFSLVEAAELLTALVMHEQALETYRQRRIGQGLDTTYDDAVLAITRDLYNRASDAPIRYGREAEGKVSVPLDWYLDGEGEGESNADES